MKKLHDHSLYDMIVKTIPNMEIIMPINPLWLLTLCRNSSLGLATKARACKGVGQEWTQESHFMLLGVQKSAREWTPTLPSELPFWELESQWIPE